MHPDVIPVAETSAINRARYAAFCRTLSTDELQLVIPGSHWRVVDYISHLATIDSWVGAWFSAWADGREFDFKNPDGSWMNIDTWNEERVVERKHAPLEALLTEAAAHRARIETTMAKFDQPLLDRVFRFRGTDITFLRYLQAWVAHDPAHTADMLKALPDRRDDPGLVEWLHAHRIDAPVVGNVNAKMTAP